MPNTMPNGKSLKHFGTEIYKALFDAPLGSVTKSELELAYFSALVRSGIVDLEKVSTFELARLLKCTPAKASNMVFNYQLRTASTDKSDELKLELAKHTVIVKDLDGPEKNRVVLNVESKFWRNVLVEHMKQLDVFSDTSFNRERLIVDAKELIDNAPKIFGATGKDLQELINSKDGAPGKIAETIQDFLKKMAGGAAEGIGQVSISLITTWLRTGL